MQTLQYAEEHLGNTKGQNRTPYEIPHFIPHHIKYHNNTLHTVNREFCKGRIPWLKSQQLGNPFQTALFQYFSKKFEIYIFSKNKF